MNKLQSSIPEPGVKTGRDKILFYFFLMMAGLQLEAHMSFWALSFRLSDLQIFDLIGDCESVASDSLYSTDEDCM